MCAGTVGGGSGDDGGWGGGSLFLKPNFIMKWM